MEPDVGAIRAAFASCNLDVASDALDVCVSLCGEFSLSADELAAQWDAYSMNNQVIGAADREQLAAFQSSLKQRQTTSKQAKSASAAGQKRRIGKVSGTPVIKRDLEADKLGSLYSMKSPDGKHPRPFASPPSSNKVQRTNGMFSPSYVVRVIGLFSRRVSDECYL